MPSHTSYSFKPADKAEGIFLVVISGVIDADGAPVGVKQNIYISAAEEAFEIKTLDGYAELLVLRMPLKEPIYQVSASQA